jgi:lipid-binding SYLF domain-containing protein
MKRRNFVLSFAATSLCALLAAAPAQAQKKSTPAEERALLGKDVQQTVAEYKKIDPAIDRFFKDSAGYVVFPRVGKGGFIFAGGHGDGELIEKGQVVGTASLTVVTVGFQVGAQVFSEIVFFSDAAALERFKQGKFELTAGASVAVIKAGAAKSANYRDGVAVFVQPRGGAMVEAAVGAQKFNYKAGK